jgi:hypothetical protein
MFAVARLSNRWVAIIALVLLLQPYAWIAVFRHYRIRIGNWSIQLRGHILAAPTNILRRDRRFKSELEILPTAR